MVTLERLRTRISIEMTGETKKYLVSAKQGDKATRYVIANLLNDGMAYIIPEGARVAFNVEKPDGKHVYNTCSYSGSEVTVELTNQTLAATGTAYCDIEVRTSDDTQLITSASFTIEIEKSMRSDDAILSSNEFTELEDRIAGHIKNINDTEAAVKKAEKARVKEEAARVTAEKARVTAEAARVTEEKARVTAEAARVTVEKARVTAENERVTAENLRNQNENTRIEQENLRQQNTEHVIKDVQDAAAATVEATKECDEAIRRLEEATKENVPKFEMNLSSGHLMYKGGRFMFQVNKAGHLEWGLTV